MRKLLILLCAGTMLSVTGMADISQASRWSRGFRQAGRAIRRSYRGYGRGYYGRGYYGPRYYGRSYYGRGFGRGYYGRGYYGGGYYGRGFYGPGVSFWF
jgi:hypothetical protein